MSLTRAIIFFINLTTVAGPILSLGVVVSNICGGAKTALMNDKKKRAWVGLLLFCKCVIVIIMDNLSRIQELAIDWNKKNAEQGGKGSPEAFVYSYRSWLARPVSEGGNELNADEMEEALFKADHPLYQKFISMVFGASLHQRWCWLASQSIKTILLYEGLMEKDDAMTHKLSSLGVKMQQHYQKLVGDYLIKDSLADNKGGVILNFSQDGLHIRNPIKKTIEEAVVSVEDNNTDEVA